MKYRQSTESSHNFVTIILLFSASIEEDQRDCGFCIDKVIYSVSLLTLLLPLALTIGTTFYFYKVSRRSREDPRVNAKNIVT